MSARRAAKVGSAGAHDGHHTGVECPWTEDQCSACLLEFAVHIGWQLTGREQVWPDRHRHHLAGCFECGKTTAEESETGRSVSDRS